MKQHALRADYAPLSRIDVTDIRQMYAVYSTYYERTEWEIFLSDLSKKSGAFLIRRKTDGRIVGFSTVVNCPLTVRGRKACGVFSGDTIIERAYWGSRVLQLAFYKYLVAEKMRNPQRALYWLLISKGFKTYLLMANNLQKFYPHPGGRNQELSEVVDAYCRQMFAEHYDAERQILDFGDNYQCLKGDVAEITETMRQTSRNIRFFEERNPEWRRGTELPCVGVVDWAFLASYVKRYASKPASKGRDDARSAPAPLHAIPAASATAAASAAGDTPDTGTAPAVTALAGVADKADQARTLRHRA